MLSNCDYLQTFSVCQMDFIKFKDEYLLHKDMCRSRGGTGGLHPPLENYKNIGFLSNTGPDLLKNHKATKPAFNVGPSSACHQNAI